MIVIKPTEDMKRIVAISMFIIVACCLPSCEKVYSEEEAGIIAEWLYSGWCYVNNETTDMVTLTITYPEGTEQRSLVEVIQPGGSIKLTIGSAERGTSIKECNSVTISSASGSQIECTRGSDDSWSRYFFSNYETEMDSEIVRLGGKKIRRNLTVEKYHIDSTLISLWNNNQ